MFEYLMPELLTPAYPDTLLHATVKAAVATQIAYGTESGTPWGISESCYNAVTRGTCTSTGRSGFRVSVSNAGSPTIS
jgi:hypothetical protein